MEKVETSFEAWRFTEEEMQAARQMSPEHRMYLQTLLADAAEEKMRLNLDPYHPLLFVQQEAYTRGQMDILAMLLNEGSIVRPKNAVVTQTQPSQQE